MMPKRPLSRLAELGYYVDGAPCAWDCVITWLQGPMTCDSLAVLLQYMLLHCELLGLSAPAVGSTREVLRALGLKVLGGGLGRMHWWHQRL